MFKSVEYAGFESSPDLKAKAEQLTPVLADVIGDRQGEVEVRWAPAADAAGVLDLTLSRTLPNGVSAVQTGTFVPDDFGRDRWLASRCNRVWSDLLGLLLDQMHQRTQEFLLQPVEG